MTFIQVLWVMHKYTKFTLSWINFNKMSITNDSFIFFLGFYKTFNRTEHAFIFKALELCGFGDNLRNIIKCFNNDTNSSTVRWH